MREQLENTVAFGTGRNAQVRGVRMGGKTGTSENIEQVAVAEEGALKDYLVSFIGFAPADDPKIIILLLLDTPSHATGMTISGGGMAAPVVGSILSEILPLSLGVVPKYTEEDLKYINLLVPGMISRNVDDAAELLANQGFEVNVSGDGETVKAQLPQPNQTVSSGTTVTLYTEDEAPRNTVFVPHVFQMSYYAAKQALEDRGLYIRAIGANRIEEKTEVSLQSIQADTEVPRGTIVEVTLVNRDAIIPN